MATPITSVTCMSLDRIDGTDCIGDSRQIINNNITTIGETLCDLVDTTIDPLNSATIAHLYDSSVRTLSSSVRDNSITTNKLATDSVTTAKLSAQAVTTDKIALSAVTTQTIANSAVTAEKINLVTSLSTNGYQIMPGGLIVQWGESPAFTAEQAQTLTFPIPFPTACLQVIAGTRFPTNDGSVNAFIQTVSWNSSQVILRTQSDLNQPTPTRPVFGHYIAIGY